MFRRKRVPWSAVSGFGIGKLPSLHIGSHHIVIYEDSRLNGLAAKATRGITGRNSGLTDTYGLDHEDLAFLMSQWRERALGLDRPLRPRSRAPAVRI
jgi:hypothetical protein